MKTVTILEAFEGYPQGDKPGSKRARYATGDEVEASNDFADLIIGKGLAREKAAEVKPPVKAQVPDSREKDADK